MRVLSTVVIAGGLALMAAGDASAQDFRCASRNYQYQFCPTGDGINRAWLTSQRSGSPCIEGQSWGWNRRGVWVSNGCDATFRVDGFRPPPGPPPGGGGNIVCESRNDQYQFCNVPGINRADLVRQLSSRPCIQGRTWGFRGEGIWVNEGCRGEFSVRSGWGPPPDPPPGPGVVHCESHEYRYNFCGTGRISNAQLVRQNSRAPCVRGQSWGVERNGIWVDSGCEGEFRVFR